MRYQLRQGNVITINNVKIIRPVLFMRFAAKHRKGVCGDVYKMMGHSSAPAVLLLQAEWLDVCPKELLNTSHTDF